MKRKPVEKRCQAKFSEALLKCERLMNDLKHFHSVALPFKCALNMKNCRPFVLYISYASLEI